MNIDIYVLTDEYHLLPRQELSGHLYPDTFSPKVHVTLDTLTSVSGHSMLSDNWIQTPVSPTPVSTRNQDTCFPTPVSKRNQDTCFPTPVSWHLFPPQKIRLLFKKICLQDIACSKDFACSRDFAYPNFWIGKFVISWGFFMPWNGS